MRDSSTVPHAGPGLAARDPTRSDPLTIAKPQVGLAVLLGLGGAGWWHWVQFGGDPATAAHLSNLTLTMALGIPASGLASWLAGALLLSTVTALSHAAPARARPAPLVLAIRGSVLATVSPRDRWRATFRAEPFGSSRLAPL